MDVEPERHIFFIFGGTKTMKNIQKFGTVATKIVEILYWASIALVVVGIVMLAITPLIITP